MLTLSKEGSLLKFTKDSGESASYDFKDKSFISPAGNKVKNIKRFFAHYAIDNLKSDNEGYNRFLKIVRLVESRCRNIGTFLERMTKYMHMEQWCLYEGLKFKINKSALSKKNMIFKNPPSFIPKDILQFFIDEKITFTTEIESKFIEDYDKASQQYRIVKQVLKNHYIDFETIIRCFDNFNFRMLISEYNYNFRRLFEHILYLVEVEGIDEYEARRLMYDYAGMMQQMNPNRKWNKYPKMLLSTHQIVVNNFNELKREYDESRFKEVTERYKHIEYCNEKEKYQVTLPNLPEDIRNEGNNLNHCVGSYINSILQDKTIILFVRKKEEPEKSYMTIEVKDGVLNQARLRFNRKPSEKQTEFLKRYCKKKGLAIGGCI